jgi:2-polyprenyl-3-methyl-5-hydroxy-6-metoxy-1,4-benzoquinol methylase
MKKKYKIIKDKEFGYLKVDPTPSSEELKIYYKEEFYKPKPFNDSSLEVQKDNQDYYNSRWDGIYKRCKLILPNKNFSVFDIGFGYAQALLYFKSKGIDVSGLEPSPECVKYARSKGLNVYETRIDDFKITKGKKFDVVLMLNVLEHLSNPQETLKSIKKNLINPEGILVIEVPNDFNDFQITAVAEHNLDEWWVCPPHHLNYFSTSSLKLLLEKCDFEIKHAQGSFPMELFLLMGDVYVGNQELGKKCHNRRVEFEKVMRKHGKSDKLLSFYEALAKLDLGRTSVIFAKSINK